MLSDVNIKKGSLHQCLGYEEDTNLQDVSSEEFLKRQKNWVYENPDVNYKKIAQKINWQRNQTGDSEFANKLTTILAKLKLWHDHISESDSPIDSLAVL